MNLREVRKKVKSVKNVKKITKAMQMVSAVKMRRAVENAESGKPYRVRLEHILSEVFNATDANSSVFFKNPKGNEAEKDLILFVSANKGLCGTYLSSLYRFLLKQNGELGADYITLGNKGSQFLGKLKETVLADFSGHGAIVETSAVFSYLLEAYVSGKYKRVFILYNKFISALRSEVTLEQVLPVLVLKDDGASTEEKEYLIEPGASAMVDPLLQTFVETQLRSAIESAQAAEHSARMLAMKNATDNAQDVIVGLTQLGNKLRQEKITNELLDMITAKESVES